MSDQEPIEAPIVFGNVKIADLERIAAFGVFEGEVFVGVGKTRREAIDSLFKAAFPSLEVLASTPQFEASPHLRDDPAEPKKRVHLDPVSPLGPPVIGERKDN